MLGASLVDLHDDARLCLIQRLSVISIYAVVIAIPHPHLYPPVRDSFDSDDFLRIDMNLVVEFVEHDHTSISKIGRSGETPSITLSRTKTFCETLAAPRA